MVAERYTSVMSKAPSRKEALEVGVRDFRDHLSEWLEQVKSGREIVVTERGRPIARVVSTRGVSALEELIRAGLATPPSEPAKPADAYPRPRSRGSVTDILLEQRR
jgi:prevent-host-death family protein